MQLTAAIRSALLHEAAETWFSAASVYELGLQAKLRRLPAFGAPIDLIASEQGFRELRINSQHMALAGGMSLDHRDPWDRIIAAQAITENLTVVTRDRNIAALGAPTLW